MRMKVNMKDFSFFIPYGIFMFFSILSTSFFYKYFYGGLYTAILAGCLLFLILGVLLNQKFKRKSIFELMGCLVIYILLGFINGNFVSTIAYIPMFLYASRDIDFNKIAKFTIKISLFTVLLIILSANIGIIDNYVVKAASGRVREFMGFRYALYPSAFAFNISCLWLYIKKDGIRWREIGFLLCFNLWIYMKTNSRLSFFLAVILITIFALNKVWPNILLRSNKAVKLLSMSYIVCFIVSFYLVYMYGKGASWAQYINDLFGNRLLYAFQSLISNGIALFGKNIGWNGFGLDIYGNVSSTLSTGYTYVDCMYIQMVQRYGLIISTIYLLIYTLTMVELNKNKDYYAVLILAFYAVHCMVDDLALYLYYNTFWFLIGTTLMATIRSVNRNSRRKAT